MDNEYLEKWVEDLQSRNYGVKDVLDDMLFVDFDNEDNQKTEEVEEIQKTQKQETQN